MSPEIRLILAPSDTYAALVRGPRRHTSPVTALRRPAIAALVLGVSVAIDATHSASPALIASTTLAWSYVVVLQLAIALPLVAGPAHHTVGLSRAVELFFAGHAPWSLFMLSTVVWSFLPAGVAAWPLAVAALLAAAATIRIVNAFFMEVLALGRPAARRRTLLQQAITWTVFVAVNWWASALTPRVVELARRL